MIASLHGTLLERSEGEAVIEVGGVGYRVVFSALTLARLPALGELVRVRVRTVVREDAFELFGFLGPLEETMFILLTSVSHVGPRACNHFITLGLRQTLWVGNSALKEEG